jgi:hypothetical protein
MISREVNLPAADRVSGPGGSEPRTLISHQLTTGETCVTERRSVRSVRHQRQSGRPIQAPRTAGRFAQSVDLTVAVEQPSIARD